MKRIFLLSTMVTLLFMVACGGGDDEPSDPCAVAITVSVETTRSSASSATGGVTVSASGGNGGFTYSLNQGTAQSSNIFSNLAVGSHSVVTTDSEGCTTTTNFEIEEELTASFAADIFPIIQSKCATSGCHVDGGAGPFTFKNYAEVSARAARIKVRTQARTMPPAGTSALSQLEIDLIAAWVDAGAQDN